jgi:hypothetical protein
MQLFDYPDKKKDPGCPTISCSIEMQFFQHALCDLGASVSVMPKAIFYELIHTPLTPTPMLLQLVDSIFHQPARIDENIPVRIREFHVPVDFVVLDMELTKGAPLKEAPLILGRPFLSTAGALIDVGAGDIRFKIHGQEVKFTFTPKTEQCNMICIKYRPNPQGLKEVCVQTQLVGKMAKNKDTKKKPAPKKSNRIQGNPPKDIPTQKKSKQIQNNIPKIIATPKKDSVWKPKEETPKPINTPPMINKMVWRPKKEQSSTPHTDTPSTSKN